MKNIQSYKAEKYKSSRFSEIEEGVFCAGTDYLTSLSFSQEPELDEGSSPSDISQYPLEDILDRFQVHVSDFYQELNAHSVETCYLEFCSTHLENIRNLRSIIGKHVYNITKGSRGNEYIDLVIEK